MPEPVRIKHPQTLYTTATRNRKPYSVKISSFTELILKICFFCLKIGRFLSVKLLLAFWRDENCRKSRAAPAFLTDKKRGRNTADINHQDSPDYQPCGLSVGIFNNFYSLSKDLIFCLAKFFFKDLNLIAHCFCNGV